MPLQVPLAFMTKQPRSSGLLESNLPAATRGMGHTTKLWELVNLHSTSLNRPSDG